MPHSGPSPPRRSPERRWRSPATRSRLAARYPALFEAALAGLPGARHADGPARGARPSFERFRALGFPGPKAEAWKYTSVRPLAREQFALRAAASRSRGPTLAPYLLQEPARAAPGVRQRPFRGRPVGRRRLPSRGRPCRALARRSTRGAAEPAASALEGDSERGFSALNGAFVGRRRPDPVRRRASRSTGPGPAAVRQLRPGPAGADQPAQRDRSLGAGARLDLVETHVAARRAAGR